MNAAPKREWIEVAEAVALGVPLRTLYRHINAGRIEKRTAPGEGGRPRAQVRKDQVVALAGERQAPAGSPPAVRRGASGVAVTGPEAVALGLALRGAAYGWRWAAGLVAAFGTVSVACLVLIAVRLEGDTAARVRDQVEITALRGDVQALREEIAALKSAQAVQPAPAKPPARSRFMGIF